MIEERKPVDGTPGPEALRNFWPVFALEFQNASGHNALKFLAALFIIGAGLSLAGTVCCLWLMPRPVMRWGLWLLTHTIYRVRVEGGDRVPANGGALFLCNHVSYVDSVLLLSSTGRQIHFLTHRRYYERWWVKPFRKSVGLIPVAPELGPRELIRSLRTAGDVIRAGGIVCVFPEGRITRTGELGEFHRGYQHIMQDVDAPIVPVALVGVWGSIFSFAGGKFFWKWPEKIPYHVTVRYGHPLPPAATPDEVRAAVQKLLAAAGPG